jgi:hypothetical protein
VALLVRVWLLLVHALFRYLQGQNKQHNLHEVQVPVPSNSVRQSSNTKLKQGRPLTLSYVRLRRLAVQPSGLQKFSP